MSKSTKQLGNTIVETINVFNDGMTSNWRDSEGFALSKNFFHYKDRLQLRPGLTLHTGADDISAMENFDNDVWGLGDNSPNRGIWKKDSFLSFSSWSFEDSADYDDDSWVFGFKNHVFYYDSSDNINFYGDITGTPSETLNFDTTFNKSVDTTFEIIKPFIHGTDGYAYFFDANRVFQLRSAPAATSGASDWTEASITIPAHLKISAACSYGEYIAIFAYDPDISKTYLYIWDRSLTLEDFVNIIEWGDGEVINAATLRGNLMGISHTSASVGYQDKLEVGYYANNRVEKLDKSMLIADDSHVLASSLNALHTVSTNEKMYFGGFNTYDGAANRGNNIYCLDSKGNITIAVSNDTVTQGIKAFVVENDKFIVAHGNDQGTYGSINDADLVDQLTFKGKYITTALDGNVPHLQKKPNFITIAHSPILTGGSVKVEYYNEELGAFTEMHTNSTVGSKRTSFLRKQSDKTHFVKDFAHMYLITVDKVQFVYQKRFESDALKDDIK